MHHDEIGASFLFAYNKSASLRFAVRRIIVVYRAGRRLVLEEVFHVFVANHLLIKGVSAGLGALHHFDNLRI